MRKKTKAPITRNNTSQKARKKAIVKRKKDTTPKEGTAHGIFYESLQEMYTICWLMELKKGGYISDIQRGTSFLLSDAVANNYVVQLKRGSKPMSQNIIQGHSYTDDYVCTPTEKGIGKFFWVMGSNCKYEKHLLVCHSTDEGYFCRIEVKPRFNRASSGSLPKAVVNIKWVLQKFGIFINIFIPEERFEKSFCPNEYLKTYTGRDRLLKYKPKTLIEYLCENQ